MTVRSVYEAGGKVPDTEDGKPPQIPQKPRDELEETEAFMARSLKRRTMEKELQVEQPPVSSSPQPQGEMSALAPVLKGYSDMMSASIEALGKFYQGQAGNTQPKDSGMTDYVKFLTEEFRSMKAKVDAPSADPLTLLVQTDNQLGQLFDRWKQREGVPKGVPVGMSDVNVMLQLEDMKLKGAREERAFQADMMKWKSEREDAQMRWKSDFDLKMLEFQDTRQGRQRAGDIFEDILGAVSDGIDSQPAGAGQQQEAGGAASQVEPARHIKAFRCSTCKDVVQVPTPDTESIACEKCGTVYDLKEGQA